MFRTSVVGLLAFAAASAQTEMPVAFANGQMGTGRKVMSGSATLRSGVFFRFRSVFAWLGSRPADTSGGFGGGGIQPGDNGIHRSMIDGDTGSFFGYDLMLLSGNASSGYTVTFGPPTHVEGGKPLPSPRYPSPQVIHDGDTIELDLMVSADGRRKLTDYIQIFWREPEPPASVTSAEPRDFTLDDGPVSFVPGFAVWKQGQKVVNVGFTGKPGSTLWVGVPNEGRYILSLIPHDGFTRAGAFRDNVAMFRAAGVNYEVRFMEPIAGAGKAWNLYMMRDASWRPKPGMQDSVTVQTDRLRDIVADGASIHSR